MEMKNLTIDQNSYNQLIQQDLNLKISINTKHWQSTDNLLDNKKGPILPIDSMQNQHFLVDQNGFSHRYSQIDKTGSINSKRKNQNDTKQNSLEEGKNRQRNRSLPVNFNQQIKSKNKKRKDDKMDSKLIECKKKFEQMDFKKRKGSKLKKHLNSTERSENLILSDTEKLNSKKDFNIMPEESKIIALTLNNPNESYLLKSSQKNFIIEKNSSKTEEELYYKDCNIEQGGEQELDVSKKSEKIDYQSNLKKNQSVNNFLLSDKKEVKSKKSTFNSKNRSKRSLNGKIQDPIAKKMFFFNCFICKKQQKNNERLFYECENHPYCKNCLNNSNNSEKIPKDCKNCSHFLNNPVKINEKNHESCQISNNFTQSKQVEKTFIQSEVSDEILKRTLTPVVSFTSISRPIFELKQLPINQYANLNQSFSIYLDQLLMSNCSICQRRESFRSFICNHNFCIECLIFNCLSNIYQFFYIYQSQNTIIFKDFSYLCLAANCFSKISVPTIMVLGYLRNFLMQPETRENFLVFEKFVDIVEAWIPYFDGLPADLVYNYQSR